VANLLETGSIYATMQRTDLITIPKRLQKVGEGQQDGHLNDHSRPRRISPRQ